MDKTENQLSNNGSIKEIQSVKPIKEEKGRKKDERSMEQVLKALNSLDTPEEKLAALCKKYAEIVEDNRKIQSLVKVTDKKTGLIQREKEQLQIEYNKAILTRSKLESLCRELQRQNKAIKDESFLKIREEEERRKETQGKFQNTLTEITTLMQQNNEKNNKLRDDNIEMSKKFKSIVEQYELREQQVERMSKQMELEGQLSEAKLAKIKTEALAEREISMREKHGLLLEIKKYQTQVKEQETLELALREQISMYTNKYDEFQNSLVKSNQVFGGFKAEMEKMSKKILKLEKETTSWKQRWEKSQTALLNMATDKQKQDAELALGNRQLQQLQKLCRTMQNERTTLLATLKASGIDRPPVPDTEPEAALADMQATAKYDKMAINCMELKNNLAELQGQLSALTSAKESGLTSQPSASVDKKPSSGKTRKLKNKSHKDVDNNSILEAGVSPAVSRSVEAVPVEKTLEETESMVTESVEGSRNDNKEIEEVLGEVKLLEITKIGDELYTTNNEDTDNKNNELTQVDDVLIKDETESIADVGDTVITKELGAESIEEAKPVEEMQLDCNMKIVQ